MLVKILVFFYLPLMLLGVLLDYPYSRDLSVEQNSKPAIRSTAQNFYDDSYAPKENEAGVGSYVATENDVAEQSGIKDAIQGFVKANNLMDKKVLEVGSGTGSLQDIVEDYTGLDISPNVAGLYHKRFVLGSATALPFEDNSFDASWTVWVLEHVPEPERMLMELRRVLKPQGLLYLCPAWNCVPWAAGGYEWRSFRDLGFGGKLIKLTIPLRKLSTVVSTSPIRSVRWGHYFLAKDRTRLRFRSLTPNYEKYWGPDSDAAVSLDSYETYLWFKSRGDRCLNCDGSFPMGQTVMPLIIRIVKTKHAQ